MLGKAFLIGVTVLAMVVGAVYLSTRGEAGGTSLAVYSAPVAPDATTGFMFVESFDLLSHRTVPITVKEVASKTENGKTLLAFEQEGRDPALVRFKKPPGASGKIVIQVQNRIDLLQAVVPFESALADRERTSRKTRDLGWPLSIDCGDYRFVLLSESGVPSVGTDSNLLLLSTGQTPEGARVALDVGKQKTNAVIEPWGGAVISFKPRSMKVRARLSLTLDNEARTTYCVTEFLAGARARGVRVIKQTMTRDADGYHSKTTIRTRTKAKRVFAMAFAWKGGRPDAMVDARGAAVRDGKALITLDLPGPGLFVARYTTMPMTDDTHGVNRMLTAGGAVADSETTISQVTDSEFFNLIGRDATPTPEAMAKARPFVLATLAASVNPGPSLLINTTRSVTTASRKAGKTRDRWLLGLLAACLGALITWMAAVTIRGHFRTRHRLMEGGEEWGPDASRINPSSGLLPVALLTFILAATVVALIFVLKTM
ncbi:MAG: hypothetical protein GXP54_01240 [Deltaproteobacteria bacterium]|nr:hypothetical protein [Deltaproteobacteria bacterium]